MTLKSNVIPLHDPILVTRLEAKEARLALQNAASVGGPMLTTEFRRRNPGGRGRCRRRRRLRSSVWAADTNQRGSRGIRGRPNHDHATRGKKG